MYNFGLDEFIEWYGQQPRPGLTQATVHAWRGALEARRLGAVSISAGITAVWKLALEGITRVNGTKSKGVRIGNWLPPRQARALP